MRLHPQQIQATARQSSDQLLKTAHRRCGPCWPKMFAEQFRRLIAAADLGLGSRSRDSLVCPGQRRIPVPPERLLSTQTGHSPCSQTRMASILGFGQHCPQRQIRVHDLATYDWPRSVLVTMQSLTVICDRGLYRRSSLLRDSTSSNHLWYPSIWFHLCLPSPSPTREQFPSLRVRR